MASASGPRGKPEDTVVQFLAGATQQPPTKEHADRWLGSGNNSQVPACFVVQV